MGQLEEDVAERLRAIMKAFGINSNPELASLCDASRSSVNNWLLGYNLPRVPEMLRLSERTGVTLDWIYSGKVTQMDPKVAVALNLLIQGKTV